MKRLLLLVASLLASLMVAELAIRIFRPQPLSGSWRVLTDKGLLVNKSGGSARHDGNGRSVRYSFSHPHLRGKGLDPEATQVLVVGDSFTFGWLLSDEEHFVHLLQKMADTQFGADRVRFLNAGTGGWGTAHYLAFVEDFGELISPEIVLVFLNTDDIGRSITGDLYRFSDNNPDELVRRIRRGSPIKRWVNRIPGYQFLLEHSHLLQLARRKWLALRSASRTPDPRQAPIPDSPEIDGRAREAVRMGNSLFLQLNRWCNERGIRLWVVTTGRHDPDRRELSKEPTRIFMAQAEQFFSRSGIPYCDISPSFFALPEVERSAFSMEGDGHPTPAGAAFIARETWNQFLSGKIADFLQPSAKGRNDTGS
jgi:hypothetical protein